MTLAWQLVQILKKKYGKAPEYTKKNRPQPKKEAGGAAEKKVTGPNRTGRLTDRRTCNRTPLRALALLVVSSVQGRIGMPGVPPCVRCESEGLPRVPFAIRIG